MILLVKYFTYHNNKPCIITINSLFCTKLVFFYLFTEVYLRYSSSKYPVFVCKRDHAAGNLGLNTTGVI